MDIIKTGIGLTKTIKNVSRFREILSVLAKHGFDEFIIQSKLDRIIPNFVLPRSRLSREKEIEKYGFWRSLGYRLRKSFAELGPSFVKVGQLMSTREDIFPAEFIKELKELQNNASDIEFADAVREIELSLQKNINEVFSEIVEKPIGLASIGVVYKAKLLDDSDVVIKVRRPNIKKVIETDFEIISLIVSRVEKVSKEIRFLGLSRAVNDFFKSIQLEMNFLIEANNNRKIAENLSKIDKDNIFVIPNVFRELSTERVLVMDYIEGTPFNQITDIGEYPDLEQNLIKGVKLFMNNMLGDGLFHADLHGGNFFQLKENKIGLLDFGLVGILSKKNRTNLVAILFALITNNYENLVIEFLDVADYEVIPDYDVLTSDIKDALTPFVGMSAKEMDVTSLTYAIVTTLSKHEIYLPRDWFIIFRALMTLDGVGKSLKIDLDIFEIIESELKGVMGELFSKDAVLEDSIWFARDLIGSMRTLPRHLSWMLKEFSKRKYTIDLNIKNLSHEIKKVSKSIFFLGIMIFASMLFLSGSIIAKDVVISNFQDIPILTIVSWTFSGLLFIRASFLFKS